MNETLSELPVKHYVDSAGKYLFGTNGDAPDGSIEVPPPEYADQVWQFPGWGESPYFLKSREEEWRTATLSLISRQLEAIEEDEADETPPDLLPGARKQWLKYRGQVSNWNETIADFPDSTKRPVAPT